MIRMYSRKEDIPEALKFAELKKYSGLNVASISLILQIIREELLKVCKLVLK